MSGRSLAEALASGLRALAGEARAPSDVADRALARMRRRRVAVRVGGPTVAVAAIGSLVAALVVVRPAPVSEGEPGPGAGVGCESALVAAHLSYPDDGSAPTASVYDWQAERCGGFRQTGFAWAVDHYERLAVLGRAGDPRGWVSDAARELGILNHEKGTEKWVELPGPGWAAFWSPDDGNRIVVSLAQRAPGGPSGSDGPGGSVGSGGSDGGVVFGGYVIVDPEAAEITQTVTVDRPALTPFQWTPDGRRVVAAFPDGVRFFDRGGQVTRELPVQGTIPVPAAVSRDGDRILVQASGGDGGRYLIVSIAGGDVVRRVTVDGTLLGWLGNDALLRVEHGENATELHSLDLVPPTDPSDPPLKTFGPEVDTVIPRLDMVYADPGPPPRSPVTDPERSPTTR